MVVVVSGVGSAAVAIGDGSGLHYLSYPRVSPMAALSALTWHDPAGWRSGWQPKVRTKIVFLTCLRGVASCLYTAYSSELEHASYQSQVHHRQLEMQQDERETQPLTRQANASSEATSSGLSHG